MLRCCKKCPFQEYDDENENLFGCCHHNSCVMVAEAICRSIPEGCKTVSVREDEENA